MNTIKIRTSGKSEMIDITAEVEKLIPADLKAGICQIFSTHTTAGITINENADPDVRHDIIGALAEMVPWDNPLFRHGEGNSAAHLKSSLLGFSQCVPIENGRLCLGTWQGIYFCEFDGPRSRSVIVNVISQSVFTENN